MMSWLVPTEWASTCVRCGKKYEVKQTAPWDEYMRKEKRSMLINVCATWAFICGSWLLEATQNPRSFSTFYYVARWVAIFDSISCVSRTYGILLAALQLPNWDMPVPDIPIYMLAGVIAVQLLITWHKTNKMRAKWFVNCNVPVQERPKDG
jgi:hypothetical protein